MNPDRTRKILADAVSHHEAGRLERAEALYRQARQALPGNFDVLHLSGLLAYQQGRIDEAVALLERALKGRAGSGACRVHLGLAYLARGDTTRAGEHLKAGLDMDSSVADGWEALALCLKMQDRLAEALECHQRAVTLRPGHAPSWCNQGLTLGFMGRHAQALACHDRALELAPGYTAARFGRAQALQHGLRLTEALAEFDAVIAAEPAHAEAWSYRLFTLQHLGTLDRERLFGEHQAYGRVVGQATRVSFPNGRDPERKLRVALLSPDLRRHSCAYFVEPLLEHLDKGLFEVYGYLDHFREDDVSARLRSHCTAWRKTVGLPDADLERRVLADAPDIVVDLAGHTAMTSRLKLFARRLAPVQVTYLGYPDTTGVPAMDFRFTDALADPAPQADRFATEALIRLPGTAWTYRPPAEAPDPVPSPARPPTFGCFNFVGKVSDAALTLWARLLNEVPGSRLVLKSAGLGDPAIVSRFQARLSHVGFDSTRVALLGHTPGLREHLALYGAVDVALDTFPYNGTTTTCEALWMGVPVVSLSGDRHAARVGASLLSAAGHPEWLAGDAEQYLRVASGLVRDPERLALLKGSLRSELRASPLLDHPGQAARFGSALRACWAAYCSGTQPPVRSRPDA